MVAQGVFTKKYNETFEFLAETSSKPARFEETRSDDLETANKTLSWVLAREKVSPFSYDLVALSLDRYLTEWESYQQTPAMERTISRAAAILAPKYQQLGIFALMPHDLREVLRITASYMLLNEMELLFTLASIENIVDNSQVLKLSPEVLASMEAGYVFGKEGLAKKSHAFKLALVLTFFLAITTKQNFAEPEEAKILMDVFPHLMSQSLLLVNFVFAADNTDIGKYSLIKVNDLSKILESESPVMDRYFNTDCKIKMVESVVIEDLTARNRKELMKSETHFLSFHNTIPYQGVPGDILDGFLD